MKYIKNESKTLIYSLVILMTSVIASSCVSNTSKVDEFLDINTSEDHRAAVGNSAFSFTPASLDFGNVTVGSISAATSITITNKSSVNLFIGETPTSDSSFTVLSTTCPLSPKVFYSGHSCDFAVRFNPISGGKLGYNFLILYGTTLEKNTLYTSSIGLSGSGVSPLSFSGVESADPVTTTEVVLNWQAEVGATTFMVFKVENNGDLTFATSVDNASGLATSATVSGLNPSTAYTFRVVAFDVLGTPYPNIENFSTITDPLGSFVTNDLAVAENATNTLNLLPLCTDLEGNVPASFSIVSESDNDGNCSVVGNTLSCSPTYKTGHADWSSVLVIRCNLNGSAIDTSFNLNVTDVNLPPSIEPIGNQINIIGGHAIAPVDANGPNDSQLDGDIYSYSCLYDTVVSGTIVGGNNCTDLAGLTFDNGTGILNWTTTSDQVEVVYEFQITVSDGTTTASEIFTIEVIGDWVFRLATDALGGLSNGDPVSSWTDTKAGITGTAAGVNRPTYHTNALNSKPIVRFDGNDFVTFNSTQMHSNTDGLTVVVVSRTLNGGNNDCFIAKYDHSISAREWGICNGNMYVMEDANPYSANYLNNVTETTTWRISTLTWTPGQKAKYYINGVLDTTAAFATNDIEVTNSKLMLGAFALGANDPMEGDIAEVLIFNKALAPSKQNAFEVYLANKWGIYHPDANWMSSSGYGAALEAHIASSKISKDSADYIQSLGLSNSFPHLILDAGSIVEADGGDIWAWPDLSGFGFHAIQKTVSAMPTVNKNAVNVNQSVLNFDGNDTLIGASTNSILGDNLTTSSVFLVYRSTSNNPAYIFQLKSNATTSSLLTKSLNQDTATGATSAGYVGILTRNSANNAHKWLTDSNAWNDGGVHLVTTWIDNGSAPSRKLRIDGTDVGNDNEGIYSVSGNTGQYYVGSSSGLSIFFSGDLLEIIYFRDALTDADRDVIEAYLMNKYGI